MLGPRPPSPAPLLNCSPVLRAKRATPAFLTTAYHKLLAHFGPQHWWPGDTPFEVAVGAILTQNTNWANVERAIANIKKANALSCRKLLALHHRTLASLIRPAGYFNVKARRLRSFLAFLDSHYAGSMTRLANDPRPDKRDALLSINGVGPETADSILLYALHHPTFVIDAYTRRILSRHNIAPPSASYHHLKSLFESAIEPDEQLFNEYHALLVMCGKHYCRPKRLCDECPLAPARA